MKLPAVRKDAELIRIHATDDMPALPVRRLLVALIRGNIDSLDIPEAIHQKDYRHLLYFLFLINRLFCIFNLSLPELSVLFLETREILDNHPRHRAAAAQDFLISGNIGKRLFMLLHQSLNL